MGACVLVLSWVLWGPVLKYCHGCYGGLCSSIVMGAMGACVQALAWVLWGPVFKYCHGCCSVQYKDKIPGAEYAPGRKKISQNTVKIVEMFM